MSCWVGDGADGADAVVSLLGSQYGNYHLRAMRVSLTCYAGWSGCGVADATGRALFRAPSEMRG
jgi:hypothetical protein